MAAASHIHGEVLGTEPALPNELEESCRFPSTYLGLENAARLCPGSLTEQIRACPRAGSAQPIPVLVRLSWAGFLRDARDAPTFILGHLASSPSLAGGAGGSISVCTRGNRGSGWK